MITIIRAVLILLLLAVAASGQDTTRRYYFERVVTGTVNRVTIRQPASGSRPLRLDGIYFYCSVACTPRISKNGTLAAGSSGAGVVFQLDERAPATPTAAVTLDGTVASDTRIFSRALPADGERSHGGGAYLGATGGKQITLEITSGAAGILHIYGEFSEP